MDQVRRVARAVTVGVAIVGLVACSSDGSNEGADGRPETLHVVTQNILHGNACPPDSDLCSVRERVALFTVQLEAAGCPELVAIQEANPRIVTELDQSLPSVCDDRYEVVSDTDPGADREIVLTTVPVLGFERAHLAGPLRTALWVRVRASVGAVDLVTTHLASSSDDGPCDVRTCPPPCLPTDTLNTCQGRQAADYLEEKRAPGSVAVLVGDLNAEPGDPTMAALLERGFVDTSAEAGADCDAATGRGCTSGRDDTTMADLTDPAAGQTERIDYVLLVPSPRCEAVAPTGVFAEEGGPPQSGSSIVFPSDHSGVEATMRCMTTEADLAAADAATTTSGSSTTVPSLTVSGEDEAAITAAFDAVFEGVAPDPDDRLRAIQDGERVRESLTTQLATQAELLAGVSVQIDSMQPAEDGEVDVVYTILLNGAAVLDHVEGRAVKEDGTWLVTLDTYCSVARLGQETVPVGCE